MHRPCSDSLPEGTTSHWGFAGIAGIHPVDMPTRFQREQQATRLCPLVRSFRIGDHLCRQMLCLDGPGARSPIHAIERGRLEESQHDQEERSKRQTVGMVHLSGFNEKGLRLKFPGAAS